MMTVPRTQSGGSTQGTPAVQPNLSDLLIAAALAKQARDQKPEEKG